MKATLRWTSYFLIERTKRAMEPADECGVGIKYAPARVRLAR